MKFIKIALVTLSLLITTLHGMKSYQLLKASGQYLGEAIKVGTLYYSYRASLTILHEAGHAGLANILYKLPFKIIFGTIPKKPEDIPSTSFRLYLGGLNPNRAVSIIPLPHKGFSFESAAVCAAGPLGGLLLSYSAL